jgi:flagellar biosynthesis chaperone FliJ
MQRFQFRLERVLEWRRKKYQMEENRLMACLSLVRATERKIEQLRAERTSIDRELLARSAIPAADLRDLGHYHLRVSKEESELAEERRQRVQSAAEQRARVQQAQQKVKLLEKMRERRLEEHTLLAGRELEQAAAEGHLARWSQSHRAN